MSNQTCSMSHQLQHPTQRAVRCQGRCATGLDSVSEAGARARVQQTERVELGLHASPSAHARMVHVVGRASGGAGARQVVGQQAHSERCSRQVLAGERWGRQLLKQARGHVRSDKRCSNWGCMRTRPPTLHVVWQAQGAAGARRSRRTGTCAKGEGQGGTAPMLQMESWPSPGIRPGASPGIMARPRHHGQAQA